MEVMKKQLESSRNSGMDCAMMVTGSALEQVTNGDLTEEFFEVSQVCKVVVACRVSPLQKSQLVRMVRESTDPQPVTLAIGDGANDVPMIQEAHVGVGISGKEGRQAVNAADFAIAQFRFLERLLLVHGRWDYRRTCKVILYTFWKNAIITMLLFYYTFYSGYSGTCMFTSTVWTSFSMILFFPIIATGIFDRDVTDLQAVEYPALYETGRKGLDLNLMKMIEMLLSAFVHSFVIMTVAVISFGDLDIGATGSYYSFSFMIFTWVVLTMNYRATFITTTINWIFLAALAVSFATYLLFAVVYTNVPMIFPEVYGLLMHVFGQSTFWMGSVAVPTLAMIIDIFKAYLMLEFYPDARDLILERSVKGSLSSSSLRKGHSEIIRRDCSQTAMVERSKSWNMSSNVSSSFAFSYPEGEWQPGRARPMRMPSVLDTSMLDKCVDPSRHIPAAAALPSSDSECGTSDCDEGASGNRPRNTAFAQQTIPSYQFLLNGRMVLCAATAGACLFGLMGISALLFSLNASQLRISYDGPELMERKNSWDLMGTKLVRPCQAPQECTFEITLPADIQAPVQVYYSVKPFYQNYFSYMSSVVPAELQGQMASEEARAVCPEQSRLTADGKDIFPCGLIATSVFNDTFEIEGMEIDTESEHMPVWRHFKNPPEYPDKAGVSWLYERYPMVTDEELGIKSKRFVAWMIPNFLNRANKPYGVISQPLLKGQKIKMRIKSSFPVTSVGAWKTVLLTRGTQNYILVWVLLFSCGLCVALVALVWGVRQFCGRENGKARDLQGFCFRDVSDSEASTTESEA
ncbi:unnamed protein product [Effrenium voratum]|nr:unnamed protein product [Effrenium voratum]